MSLNNIVLAGNLGDDPEVFYSSQSGEPVANFDLAFHSGKDKNGDRKTGWIRCVCFKRLAEIAETYLHKGARIGIIGSLDENTWETEDHQKRKTFQVIVHSMEFIKTDGRGFADNQQSDDVPF